MIVALTEKKQTPQEMKWYAFLKKKKTFMIRNCDKTGRCNFTNCKDTADISNPPEAEEEICLTPDLLQLKTKRKIH